MEIPWNDFHGMFSMIILWSIKLGHLICRIVVFLYEELEKGNQGQLAKLLGGLAVGRWTCDLQVAGSIPGWSAFT